MGDMNDRQLSRRISRRGVSHETMAREIVRAVAAYDRTRARPPTLEAVR